MSKENHSSTGHIVQSLIVNFVIACSKGAAAFMTHSGAMLAETIHSFADCANQGLLLRGVKQAQRAPDTKHPLGYGRSLYFWSFMVAMMLFSVGGMFSIYEGVHKFMHPEMVENILWGVGVLVFAILLEGYATYSNVVELNKRRAGKGFWEYLRFTKDSDMVVVFGENSAAVLGLVLALVAMLISYYTGDGRYDAVGSIAVGVVLILVAIFLSVEVKSLLIGESADPFINQTAEQIATKHPSIKRLISCMTIQQGPGEVIACVKIQCEPHLKADDVSHLIDDFEQQLKAICPEVKWSFVEPDLS